MTFVGHGIGQRPPRKLLQRFQLSIRQEVVQVITPALKRLKRLRVCNAYASSDPLDVLLGNESVTQEEPLAYKTCKDFSLMLKVGDMLNFKVGFLSASSFTFSTLSDSKAVMLLAICRPDLSSAAVSFESHLFAEGQEGPQVAIIDASNVHAAPTLRISQTSPTSGKDISGTAFSELQFNTSVVVSPGIYQLALLGGDASRTVIKDFVARQNVSYVVIRTGSKSVDGTQFLEDLVVFPKSAASEHSAAQRVSYPAVVVMAAFGALLMLIGC